MYCRSDEKYTKNKNLNVLHHTSKDRVILCAVCINVKNEIIKYQNEKK